MLQLLLSAVPVFCENMTDRTVEYVNNLFADTVGGEGTELFTLLEQYYEQRQLVNGFTYKIVALLQNKLTESTQLHYFKTWTNFNESDFKVLEHQVPVIEECEEMEDVVKAVKLQLKDINERFKGIGDWKCQKVVVTPFFDMNETDVNDQEPIEISLHQTTLLSSKHKYTATTVLNDSNYNVHLYSIGDNSRSSKKNDQGNSAAIFISVIASVILASGLTYFLIYLYWKKLKTIPFVKHTEENTRLAFNMNPVT